MANPIPVEIPFHSQAGSPTQLGETSGHELKGTRRIATDIQRGSIILTYAVTGTPEEAEISHLFTNMQIGDPHPDREGHYISRLSFEAIVTSDESSERWTKATISYELRPCPHAYEETGATSLISRNEWYGRDPLVLLQVSQQAIPVLIPQNMYLRKYLNVPLDQGQIADIKKWLGYTNNVVWHDGVVNEWFFEVFRYRSLSGNPLSASSEQRYELIFGFRSDPLRLHQWWWPILITGTLTPKQPGAGDTYTSLHNKRAIYPSTSFDDTVFNHLPTELNDCTHNP